MTGDGKADAIVMFPGAGNLYVAPSTGAGFTRDPATWQWTDTFGLGSRAPPVSSTDVCEGLDGALAFDTPSDLAIPLAALIKRPYNREVRPTSSARSLPIPCAVSPPDREQRLTPDEHGLTSRERSCQRMSYPLTES